MAWRIGVDSGGTFTDICLFDEKKRSHRGLVTGLITSNGDAVLGSLPAVSPMEATPSGW